MSALAPLSASSNVPDPSVRITPASVLPASSTPALLPVPLCRRELHAVRDGWCIMPPSFGKAATPDWLCNQYRLGGGSGRERPVGSSLPTLRTPLTGLGRAEGVMKTSRHPGGGTDRTLQDRFSHIRTSRAQYALISDTCPVVSCPSPERRNSAVSQVSC